MSHDRADPHLFVIFGVTGDLARGKLLPAVWRLFRDGRLEGGYHILGVSRDPDLDDRGLRQWARQALAESGLGGEQLAGWCDRCLSYQRVEAGDGYRGVAARIEELERAHGLPGNRLFYMALPPQVFPEAIRGLGEAGLARGGGWTRLVIEKPFGNDLPSALELNALLHRWFDESQVFRIDHYLGKETVQNLLVFRFANAIFESLWNRERVDNVQITVAEEIGVGSRAGYYDQVGAVRDMVQNHLTQLLTLVAMEVPFAYEAAAVRHEKIKVLRSVAPIRLENVVYGQYTGAPGSNVPTYRHEPGVTAGSRTETFAALKIEIDNWRWQGVPFYLRTGKRLARRHTEIAVTFRNPPVALFESLDCSKGDNDVLLITVQPNEGFSLFFDVKRPGEPLTLEKIPLAFQYEETFGALPDAYVTLLLDVLTGDQTLFVHAEEVEVAWRLYTPLLERNIHVYGYPAGSWGPAEADLLAARDGRIWRTR